MYTSSFSLLTFLNLINNMSRQFIYIPVPNPLPPQKDKLDKIFRQSLHMYQSLHILVSNVLVWVSKYNVCNSAVFSGFPPQTPFFIAFLHSYSSWTAPISKSPRTSRHATTWLYTCVGIPPAFNCWSKFQPSHLWGGKLHIPSSLKVRQQKPTRERFGSKYKTILAKKTRYTVLWI